jgi:hypothetical protein
LFGNLLVLAEESIMSFQQPLTPELEAQAQELLTHLRSRTDEDLLALARLLVSKADHEIFGETEFQVRDIVHRLGAKALETHLAQKKTTATKAPVSSARTANRPLNSTATGPKRPLA